MVGEVGCYFCTTNSFHKILSFFVIKIFPFEGIWRIWGRISVILVCSYYYIQLGKVWLTKILSFYNRGFLWMFLVILNLSSYNINDFIKTIDSMKSTLTISKINGYANSLDELLGIEHFYISITNWWHLTLS